MSGILHFCGLLQQAALQSVFGSNPACVHDEYEKHARSKKTTSPVRFQLWSFVKQLSAVPPNVMALVFVQLF